jgi:hypothetical protein
VINERTVTVLNLAEGRGLTEADNKVYEDTIPKSNEQQQLYKEV